MNAQVTATSEFDRQAKLSPETCGIVLQELEDVLYRIIARRLNEAHLLRLGKHVRTLN